MTSTLYVNVPFGSSVSKTPLYSFPDFFVNIKLLISTEFVLKCSLSFMFFSTSAAKSFVDRLQDVAITEVKIIAVSNLIIFFIFFT